MTTILSASSEMFRQLRPRLARLARRAPWAALWLAGASLAADAADPAVKAGERAYMVAGCYQCHGTVGQGGVGPRLAPKPMPVEALALFVRTPPRAMPPYGTNILNDQDIKAIHLYLSSIAPSPTVEQIPALR